MEQIITGIVVDNWNEEQPGKVQVAYTLGEDGQVQTGWIPVVTPYGGSGYGIYHLPEAGATVAVGFLHGNAASPVVLGCMWSQDNPLPGETANEKNSKKLWKTKAGYQITVDEEEKKVGFTDPSGENTMEWSHEEGHGHLTLNIKEKLDICIGGEAFLTMEKGKAVFAGNITIQGEELKLTSQKAMCAEAGGALSLKSDKDLGLEAQGDMSAKGKNISLSPVQKLSAGGMKAEIAPSQEVTVKGMQVRLEGADVAVKAKAKGKVESQGILELKGSMMKLN